MDEPTLTNPLKKGSGNPPLKIPKALLGPREVPWPRERDTQCLVLALLSVQCVTLGKLFPSLKNDF